jgi:hypothetical protein
MGTSGQDILHLFRPFSFNSRLLMKINKQLDTQSTEIDPRDSYLFDRFQTLVVHQPVSPAGHLYAPRLALPQTEARRCDALKVDDQPGVVAWSVDAILRD